MTQTLQIDVDGVSVEGVITHRSGSDIVVEITEPFSGLRQQRHLMNLARQAFPDGFLGARGDDVAHELLRNLYNLGLELEIDWAGLSRAVAPYMVRIRELTTVDETEFMRRRRVLREKLRRGEIDLNAHSLLQKELRRDHLDYEHVVDQIKDEFIVANLPRARCISLREQIWSRLTSTPSVGGLTSSDLQPEH
jgi:hypothetical protein